MCAYCIRDFTVFDTGNAAPLHLVADMANAFNVTSQFLHCQQLSFFYF